MSLKVVPLAEPQVRQEVIDNLEYALEAAKAGTLCHVVIGYGVDSRENVTEEWRAAWWNRRGNVMELMGHVEDLRVRALQEAGYLPKIG